MTKRVILVLNPSIVEVIFDWILDINGQPPLVVELLQRTEELAQLAILIEVFSKILKLHQGLVELVDDVRSEGHAK